jgi:hypothetical protein
MSLKGLIGGVVGATASTRSFADKYGLDELEKGSGSGTSVLTFAVGLVVSVNAWHRYNKQGASGTEAVLQGVAGVVVMLIGASMS